MRNKWDTCLLQQKSKPTQTPDETKRTIHYFGFIASHTWTRQEEFRQFIKHLTDGQNVQFSHAKSRRRKTSNKNQKQRTKKNNRKSILFGQWMSIVCCLCAVKFTSCVNFTHFRPLHTYTNSMYADKAEMKHEKNRNREKDNEINNNEFGSN